MQEKINKIRNLVADWLRQLEALVRQCEPRTAFGERLTLREAKLQQVVQDFENARLERLHEKEKQGYKGWDKKKPTDLELFKAMQKDTNALEWLWGSENKRKALLDIANRAMMLWYRTRASA